MNGDMHLETNMMMEPSGSQEMMEDYGETCLQCMSLYSKSMDIAKK